MIQEPASAGLAEPVPAAPPSAASRTEPAPRGSAPLRLARGRGRLVTATFVALVACMMTVQIDLLPVATVREMPIRPGLVAFIATAVLGLVALARRRRWPEWPAGSAWLLGVAAWNAAVTLADGPDAHGLGYLTLTAVLTVAAIVVGMLPRLGLPLHRLVSAFRWSFVAMAVFGLLQFVLDNFGVPTLVQLHWANGVPRVNGLSSEPSYYATYMLAGLPLCHSRARLHGRGAWHLGTAVVILAITLSNSRIGMMATGLWGVFEFLVMRGGWRTRTTAMAPVALAGLLALGLQMGVMMMRTPGMGWPTAKPGKTAAVDDEQRWQMATRQMFEGTGVAGTNPESRDARLRGFRATSKVAREHALTGVGIGHVRREAIRITGHPYSAVINVTLELLAGIGVIGLLLFAGWLVAMARSLVPIVRAGGEPGRAAWDLTVGLGLMWFALQANQNPMRLPLWLQIGLLIAVVSEARRPRPFARPAAITPLR